MQTVLPFRAWRYALAAGDLSRLVAPPYDVIDAALQSQLYASSRYNVVRIDLGMTTPSDNDCDNQYTRAATQLAEWRSSGILERDQAPTVTFVEESFLGPDGRAGTRHGFLALIRLHDFEEGVVFPHEWTLTGPKEDRFRLMTATSMSLSPVFLLYDLPSDRITAAWSARLSKRSPAAVVAGGQGAVTTLWPTSDPAILETIAQELRSSRFVIADGHHRYETALRYRKEHSTSGVDTPLACDYAPAYFANMADPGLAIYGTHRLLSGLDPKLIADLPQSLDGTFVVDRLNENAGSAQPAIAAYLEDHPRGSFGLWGPGLDAAYGIRLVDPAAARAAAPGHSAAYQGLDVTILQTLVLQKTLGITPEDLAAESYVTYFKDPNEAFSRLAAGEFQAGFFMNPTRLDQIREVAFGGERMPPKATFFHPKLPTGLVFHDLSGGL